MGRILVIEDDRDIADLCCWALVDEGYECRSAVGQDAIDQAREWRPDAVLLDMLMPELDGWQVAAELRRHAETERTPLIPMTASHRAPQCAAELGVPDFLAKPFNIRDLLRVVRRSIPA